MKGLSHETLIHLHFYMQERTGNRNASVVLFTPMMTAVYKYSSLKYILLYLYFISRQFLLHLIFIDINPKFLYDFPYLLMLHVSITDYKYIEYFFTIQVQLNIIMVIYNTLTTTKHLTFTERFLFTPIYHNGQKYQCILSEYLFRD